MHPCPHVPLHPTKRAFDVVVSVLLLLISAPLIVVFIFLIIAEHFFRGRVFDPLVYSETRWSEGRHFKLYKFNIFDQAVIDEMRRNGVFIHTKALERNNALIRVGWLLKQIYLDELPQLVNVLRGDMSIVGPRPVNTEVRAYLLQEGACDKDSIRAGITGYYQSCHKASTSSKSQVELDREYVAFVRTKPWYKVLWFDITIIARTIKVLLMARGI